MTRMANSVYFHGVKSNDKNWNSLDYFRARFELEDKMFDASRFDNMYKMVRRQLRHVASMKRLSVLIKIRGKFGRARSRTRVKQNATEAAVTRKIVQRGSAPTDR